MIKIILIPILCLINLSILSSAVFSVKLKKNLVLQEEGDNYFIARLASAAIDDKGNIYIADSKQTAILKFTKEGEFIKQRGRRGEGPGEFPGEISHIEFSNKKIYLTLKYIFSNIYVFNDNLKYLNTIKYKYDIFSFRVKNNKIYIPNTICKKDFTIDIVNKYGKITNNPNKISAFSKIIYKNLKIITIDKESNIYIVSMFEDKIEKWNNNQKKIWSKYMFSGQKFKYKKMKDGSVSPYNTYWYRDVALDTSENVYILSGSFSRIRFRDIYVISKYGKFLTMFTLPITSTSINIDNKNNIYITGQKEDKLIRYKLIFEEKNTIIKANSSRIKKGGMLYEYINAKK